MKAYPSKNTLDRATTVTPTFKEYSYVIGTKTVFPFYLSFYPDVLEVNLKVLKTLSSKIKMC